jgi:hypothetical protein
MEARKNYVGRAASAVHRAKRADPAPSAARGLLSPVQEINRRTHPLRRERRFPHSLSVTEGVKIGVKSNDQTSCYLITLLIVLESRPSVVKNL